MGEEVSFIAGQSGCLSLDTVVQYVFRFFRTEFAPSAGQAYHPSHSLFELDGQRCVFDVLGCVIVRRGPTTIYNTEKHIRANKATIH
jgi:hypothetical protein